MLLLPYNVTCMCSCAPFIYLPFGVLHLGTIKDIGLIKLTEFAWEIKVKFYKDKYIEGPF